MACPYPHRQLLLAVQAPELPAVDETKPAVAEVPQQEEDVAVQARQSCYLCKPRQEAAGNWPRCTMQPQAAMSQQLLNSGSM